jgi:catechol 2,3-dioxygenase-like lactoylglutathione lyase family enzyme
MNMKLELVAVPVSDVERSIEFYKRLGFNLDQDNEVNPKLRFVQMTPPGSACSIAFGIGLDVKMDPGKLDGLQMVVVDIEATKKFLEDKGIEHRGIEDFPWGRFIFFLDPDGNGWAIHQLTERK